MKKCLKVLGILGIILAGIVALYILACGNAISVISKAPETVPAQFVTDFTLLEEKSYEISEGDISMRIPTYYVTTNLRDYYTIAGESKSPKRSLALFYKPFRQISDKYNTSQDDYTAYLDALKQFEENKPGYPMNLLFDVPEDIFELYKKIATVNKHNYKFWNIATVLETAYYLDARQIITSKGLELHAIYERDNVRAIIYKSPDLNDYFTVMLFPKYNPENLYLFGVETPELDEVIKMLNTFEYTTGLGF